MFNILHGGEKMLGKYVRIKITDPIGSVRDGTRFVFPLCRSEAKIFRNSQQKELKYISF